MMANFLGGMEGLFRRRGTEVEVQKLLGELGLRNQQLEYELLEMRRKAHDLNQKEVEITNMEEKLRKKEQILERQSDKVKERDKAADAKLKLSIVKEEYIKVEGKNLVLQKQEISSEMEKLVALKDELERMKGEIHQKQLQIDDENEALEFKTELLLKEQEGLKQGRKQLEVEREELEGKNLDVSGKLQQLMEEKQILEKLRNSEDLRLCKEKIANVAYIREEERERALVNINNRMEEIEKIIQLMRAEKDGISPKTTNLLPELSPADKQAARKRARADETPSMTEAEGRKRRQLVDLNKKITDESPGYNGEDERAINLLDANGNDDKHEEEEEEEEEEDEDSDHPGKTSMARKFWKFFTT